MINKYDKAIISLGLMLLVDNFIDILPDRLVLAIMILILVCMVITVIKASIKIIQTKCK